MTGDEVRVRSTSALAVLVALALAAFAGFMALGTWQVRRLAWKEDLIARVDARLHAAPVAAPARKQWAALDREDDEYRRVIATGRFDYADELLVHASTVLGSGYWVLTPLRTVDGEWLFVNRGFVPPEMRGHVPHGDAQQTVVGLLRFTEPKGGFLRTNDAAHGHWYSRDVAAMAAEAHLATVAPCFIDQQAMTPGDATVWPRPGLTVVRFPNNHLVYALTWFALAAGVAAAAVYVLVQERQLRRGAPAPSRAC